MMGTVRKVGYKKENTESYVGDVWKKTQKIYTSLKKFAILLLYGIKFLKLLYCFNDFLYF